MMKYFGKFVLINLKEFFIFIGQMLLFIMLLSYLIAGGLFFLPITIWLDDFIFPNWVRFMITMSYVIPVSMWIYVKYVEFYKKMEDIK
jgi:hypothetical protein